MRLPRSPAGCRAARRSGRRAQLDRSDRKSEVLSRYGPQLINCNQRSNPFFLFGSRGAGSLCLPAPGEGEEAIILRALSGLMTLPDAPLCVCYSASSGTVDKVATLARQQGCGSHGAALKL